MSRLILIRHSSPEIDPQTPATAWRLNPQGERAAKELAVLLDGFDFSTVFASPELKARQTAELIAARRKAMVSLDGDLREHERRAVGFLPGTGLRRGVERLLRSPGDLVFGDETADAVFARFDAALRRAVAHALRTDLAVVTHATALSIYLGRTLGIDPLDFWRGLATPTAAVVSGQEMQILTPPSAISR